MSKKRLLLGIFTVCLVLLVSAFPALAAETLAKVPGDPAVIPQGLAVNWDNRHSFEEGEAILSELAAQYPQYTEKYSIGTSWQERNLWCLEITNEKKSAAKKTGIGVFGNIHGGEHESGECALYTAWWFLLNSDTEYVEKILDNYVIYVVPYINPDGYVQSFVYNNRTNLRPTDRNGNGIPFSDPYTDINGDGAIAEIYKGTASAASDARTRIGMESPDWDNNGVLGDDPRSSTIDMNRTFDYQWNRYDIETYVDPNGKDIGSNSWASAGPAAASEPEIQAVQNFLIDKPMNALVTLHTGIQCVLWPWCYRPYEADNPLDADIPFMEQTGTAMAEAFAAATGRNFYAKPSHSDYPTSAEMIDYAYGKLNIHAYTIEVYRGGMSNPTGTVEEQCCWNNELPDPTWTFYSQKQLLDQAMLSKDTIEKLALAQDEGLWFYNSSRSLMSGVAPTEQSVMVKGCKDSILVMIDSEPYGKGKVVPAYLQ